MIKSKSPLAAILFFAVFLCTAAHAQHKLVKTKVNDGLTVVIPKEWIPMDEMDFTQRYPSVRAPLAAYTNQERTVDFSVNVSATQWPDDDIELSQKFFKASLLNMFDKVEMIDEGIREVNGRKMVFFEFVSRVNGNKRELSQKDAVLQYTFIQYYIGPSRTLVFSFHSPRRLQEEWQKTAREMMERISVKNVAPQQSKK